jgi:hypothetical protein
MELYEEALKKRFYIGPLFVLAKVHAVNSAALVPLLNQRQTLFTN